MPITASNEGRGKKGVCKMSSQSNLKRTVVSVFAALLMSSVAVGSAVAPAHVNSAPSKYLVHA
jgi:hypothetical protein